MGNIEFKLEVTEKLYDDLKTIAKEQSISREQLSVDVIERYITNEPGIIAKKVEEIKEILTKEQLNDECKYRAEQMLEKKIGIDIEILDLIIPEDLHLRLESIKDKEKTTFDYLVTKILTEFTCEFSELLDEKDRLKKERKEREKEHKALQREKKHKKKEKEKQKRVTRSK